MKNLKYWKTVIWAVVVFVLSSLPGNDLEKISFINIPYFDKLVHFGMYAVLTFLFLFEQNNNALSLKPKTVNIVLIGAACISYGLILEMMQKYLFSQRSAEFADFLANSFGSIVAILTFYYIVIKKKTV